MMHDQPKTEVGIGAADRPATVLEDHARHLDNLLNNLERAALQYDNLLTRLRGDHPTTETSDVAPSNKLANPAMISRIQITTDHLNDTCSRLNNAADELNELI